jgi:hypothetical protein
LALPSERVLVAERDGQVVGALSFHLTPMLARTGQRRENYLSRRFGNISRPRNRQSPHARSRGMGMVQRMHQNRSDQRRPPS